jgi:hypothetical protein
MYRTVPIRYRVPFQCSTVYGTVAAVVYFEWIVLVLTKLVKSVKCHTLPLLRRDMDNENVYSLLVPYGRWRPQPGRR